MQKSASDAVAVFNRYAGEYAGRFMDMNLYKFSLDAFCKSINKKFPEILDLFCGPGNVSRYILQKIADAKITGADLAPEMIKIAAQNNPSANFLVMDCRKVKEFQKLFDGVIIGFGFPYLDKTEVEVLINSLPDITLDHAGIYVSTMEDDYAASGIEKTSKGEEIFLHYYPEKFLGKVFNDAGFVKVYRERISNTMPNGKQVTDLILQFIKQDTKNAFIQQTPQLNEEEILIVNELWNTEFSSQLNDKFKSLLNNQSDFYHYLFYENGRIKGWAATFNRDDERWFSILVSRNSQNNGIGKKLILKLQEDHESLNGWVVDHDKDIRADGTVYLSPLSFYEKLGFRILPEHRSEKYNLSAVKITWNKQI